MENIKFRAWDLDNNQMYFKGDNFGTTHDYEPLLYKKQGQNVIPMQYTGLKDKKGKEIFEGDILSGNSKLTFGAVMFKNGSYWIKGGHHKGDGVTIYDEAIYAHELTIIGNIYENSDLLRSI